VDEDRKLKRLIQTQPEALGSYVVSGRQLFTTLTLPEDVRVFVASLGNNEEEVLAIFLERVRDVAEHDPIVFQF